MANRLPADDAEGSVSGAEQGAHAGISQREPAGGNVQAVADQAAADHLAFEDGLDGFSGQAIAPPAKRGAGRPAGSPNRATSKVREYLLARGYRDPLEQAAALVTADPRELAAKLANKAPQLVTFGEALAVLAEQGKARGQLLPYFHQEMPKPKEPEREVERHFVVIVDSPEKAQQVQRVIDARANPSQGEADDWLSEPVVITDEFRVRDHD
jgi:hypothetical protein